MIRATTKYTVNDNEFDTTFTVFSPNDRGKSIVCNLSSSRKCNPEYDKKIIDDGIAKEYNGNYYVSSNWNAIFTGKAYNKAKKYNIESYSRITNVVCDISNEPYNNSDGETIYNHPSLRIIDFDFVESQNSNGMDTPPRVANDDEDDEDLPF